MKIYKFLFYLGLISLLSTQGCEKGIVEDEIPIEYQNALTVKKYYADVRELFVNKLCGINYPDKPLQNYIQQVTALDVYQIDTIVEDGLPENELWRITINLKDSAEYESPNNGWLFSKAEFDKDDSMNPSFIDLNADGYCRKIKMPVDLKRLVVSLDFEGDFLEQRNNEVSEQLDGAPTLGLMGDFSVPHRYVIRNKWEREDGTHKKRVIEIRVQFTSDPKY